MPQTGSRDRIASPAQLTAGYVASRVREALDEDLGPDRRDVTTDAVVPETLMAEAELLARSGGVVAGLAVAEEVFRQVDPGVRFEAEVVDGARLAAGTRLAGVTGRLRSLLRGERVALNFLQQLSGVATLTRRYVDAVGPGVAVLDTRKTVPGLRAMQRLAVLAGGGVSHRFNLADAVLVKDNHVAAAGGVVEAVRRVRAAGLPVEVEIEDLADLEPAIAAGAEIVLLDNMTPAQVAAAVRTAAGRAVIEVSGGVTLETIATYAASRPDRISVGALTHSAPALDVSMEVTRTWQP